MRSGFRVEITKDDITLPDGDEELVRWDTSAWAEDPSVVPVIATAITIGHTEGPDGVRVHLIPSSCARRSANEANRYDTALFTLNS